MKVRTIISSVIILGGLGYLGYRTYKIIKEQKELDEEIIPADVVDSQIEALNELEKNREREQELLKEDSHPITDEELENLALSKSYLDDSDKLTIVTMEDAEQYLRTKIYEDCEITDKDTINVLNKLWVIPFEPNDQTSDYDILVQLVAMRIKELQSLNKNWEEEFDISENVTFSEFLIYMAIQLKEYYYDPSEHNNIQSYVEMFLKNINIDKTTSQSTLTNISYNIMDQEDLSINIFGIGDRNTENTFMNQLNLFINL